MDVFPARAGHRMGMKMATRSEAMEFSFDVVFHDNPHPLGMHHPWHKSGPFTTTFEEQDALYTYCPDACWAMPSNVAKQFPNQCKPYNIPVLKRCEFFSRWW